MRLPALFSDHMVFQQMAGNPVWGWAEPKEKVTVKTSWGETHSETAGEDGRWMVTVYTPKAGTGHKVTIQASNKIVLKKRGHRGSLALRRAIQHGLVDG